MSPEDYRTKIIYWEKTLSDLGATKNWFWLDNMKKMYGAEGWIDQYAMQLATASKTTNKG